MSRPISDPVFDIGRDLQRAYDEGYKQGRYDEKVETETSLPSGEQTHTVRSETHACDLISRQAAIDEIARWIGYLDDDMIGRIQLGLKRLSSEEPKTEWIPCSERLPEVPRQVLVYARSVHYALAKYDEMRQADGTYKKEWVTFDAWKPYYTIKDAIKWMPLPEP